MTTRYKAARRKGRNKSNLRRLHNQQRINNIYSENTFMPKVEKLEAVDSFNNDHGEVPVNKPFAVPAIADVQETKEPLQEVRALVERSGENSNLILLKPAAQVEEIPDEVEALASHPETDKPLRVMLIAEGTYPFHWGGVSTWCHLLIRDLPEVNFILYSLVADPHAEPRINLLPNVVDFIPMPLWGVREVLELRSDLEMSELRWRNQQTYDEIIEEKFVPIFRTFLKELYLKDSEPERLGQYVHQMYRYFLEHDYDTTFHSQPVWNCFIAAVQEYFPLSASERGYSEAEFTLDDITQGLQWLYHWCFPLAKPLPQVDIAHASTAGISTMIGVIAKLEHGAAFLLSEHGIYLRERYLAEAASSSSLFLKLLALRFARRMTDLSYVMSDQISPCCDYNQRWELQNGTPPERLRTIYYGADADKFYAGGKPFGDPPVVVWVGRINPLKDVITLLQAAALVHEERPDIQFKLYGTPPPEDQPYYEECLALHKKLELENVVIFAGYSSNPAVAYNEGDVVLLSSISEGFPFATLEAMLCGKAVVATSVGGLPEQIEGCGIVVEPRNPREMADGVLKLMNNAELCIEYGKAAREKALEEFSVHQSRESYLSSYLNILKRSQQSEEAPALVEEKVEMALAHAVGETLPYEVSNISQLHLKDQRVFAGPSEVRQLVQAERSETGLANSNFRRGNSTIEITNSRATRPARRRLQLMVANQSPEKWEPRDQEGIRALAKEILRRDRYPIDYLEVGALLESMGTTDEMAHHHYGAPNTFELAKVVLEEVRIEQQNLQELRQPPSETRQTLGQIILNYLQGPIAFLPGAIVLMIIQVYSFSGQWSAGQIMALSLGMSGGLLMTNGFLQAVMRRTSICLALNNPRAARYFLLRSLGLAELCMVGLAFAVMIITSLTGALTVEERLTFCVAFVALSTIWLIGGPLTLVQEQIWLGASLGIGLLSGFLIDRLVALFFDWHMVVGSIIGFGLTVGVLLLVWQRAFTGRSKAAKNERIILPSKAYLLNEATPYFLYGILYAALITLPHVLGWFGKVNLDQSRQWAITNLEIGLSLSMPPLVLTGGVAERVLRQFWLKIAFGQKVAPGLKVEHFGQMLQTFYYQQRWRYALILALFNLAYGLPVWFILSQGTLKDLIGQKPEMALLFFFAGVITFFLLGLGVFNCMFYITLVRPWLAAQPVFIAILVLLGIGIPLSIGLNFAYFAVAFILAALAFVKVSGSQVKQILKEADYYCFASF